MEQIVMAAGHGGRLSVRTDSAGRPIGKRASGWLCQEVVTPGEMREGQECMERVDGPCGNLMQSGDSAHRSSTLTWLGAHTLEAKN